MRVSTLESEAEAQQAVLDLNNAGYAKLMAKRPKPSTTQFHILSHELWMGHPVTRVQLLPITGRTHQLRVHCAALGHPILGDPAYGFFGEAHAHGGFGEDELKIVSPTFASFELRRDVEKIVRESGRTMCLHARKLMLDHPVTKERVSFEVAPSF
jgi:23S rRNA-/tRNA-specific pseudouridylate synthase